MRSSLLLLLEGMAHFLPSPERQYCYSQRKFSDVYVGRHQHQAIKNICNLEDGASTCSDRFGPLGRLYLFHAHPCYSSASVAYCNDDARVSSRLIALRRSVVDRERVAAWQVLHASRS